MKKIGIFMYESSPLFEIAIAAYILHTAYDIVLITDSENILETTEGIGVYSDVSIENINFSDYHALIICGGNINNIQHREILKKFVTTMFDTKKVIASICAGTVLVSNLLNLSIKPISNTTVISKQLIFSPPNEYAEFGIKIGEVLEIYKDKEDFMETIEFFSHL